MNQATTTLTRSAGNSAPPWASESRDSSLADPGGQFNFLHLWARKFPHPVKQDEIVI